MMNLLPTWTRKLTTHQRTAILLRRLLSSDLRQLLKGAAPVVINNLLYIGEESAKVCSHRLPFCVSIESFSRKHLSGLDRIDKRLTPNRTAYVVIGCGEIVHETWVRFDALTPSLYGFDASVPVIESFTNPTYRGNGIFPFALNCILKDLKSRHITDKAYALVLPTNNASIQGLEKAGFQLLAHLKGTRYLGLLITKKSIERTPESLDRQHAKSLELPIAS